jgi:hypothetical protein
VKRILLATLLAMVALPALAVSSATAASAQPLTDLTCPFSATVNASPGYSLASQAQQITGQIALGSALLPATPCSSLFGTPYHGATGTITGSGTQNCLLVGSVTGTIDLTWDNGATSTITFSESAVIFVPVVTASVTSGALKGSSIVVAPIPTGFTGNCLLTPATSLTITGVAEILDL